MPVNHLSSTGMKDSDENDFSRVYHKYHARLLMEAFFLLESEQQAKDIVQEVFIDCWNKQYWKTATNIGAYLGTAVRNRCLNQIKKNKTNEKRITSYLKSLEYDQSDDEAQTSREPLIQNRLDNLEMALKTMPEKTGTVLRLYYLDNKDRQTVASELGISVNTVKTVLQRGLKALRKKLK